MVTNESSDFLTILFDTIPNPVFYKDTQGRYLGCNSHFAEQILGCRKENIIGKTILELTDRIPPDLAALYQQKDDELFANRSVQIYLADVWCADGVQRKFLFNKAPFVGPQGKICGLIGSMVDISAGLSALHDLKQAHTEMENLLASIDSILIGIRLDYTVTLWNKTDERIFGLSKDSLHNLKLDELGLSWDWPALEKGLKTSKSSQKYLFLNDIPYTNLEGQPGYLGIKVNPVFDEANKISGFLIFGTDVTEKRLMGLQLLQDQKLKSIGELAAGIAHEINSPTQYAKNNLEFLEKAFASLLALLPEPAVGGDQSGQTGELDLTYLRTEIPSAIRQSLEGLNRIASIVNSMKNFAHPHSGGQKTLFDIHTVINDCVELTRNEWKYHADLILKLDAPSSTLLCFPDELNQVLINLLVNAGHAVSSAKEGKQIERGKIEIATYNAKEHLVITIRDNGIGIPDEIKDRVFDPFFTTKELGKGTGQGLAISLSIIKKNHNGKIYFNSQANKGTTFYIQLPLWSKDNE